MNNSINTTVAQAISARLGDDGQDWRGFEDAAESQPHRIEYRDGHGTDTYRYVYADGSVIMVAGDCWDVGHTDCYCMAGAGHTERCATA